MTKRNFKGFLREEVNIKSNQVPGNSTITREMKGDFNQLLIVDKTLTTWPCLYQKQDHLKGQM